MIKTVQFKDNKTKENVYPVLDADSTVVDGSYIKTLKNFINNASSNNEIVSYIKFDKGEKVNLGKDKWETLAFKDSSSLRNMRINISDCYVVAISNATASTTNSGSSIYRLDFMLDSLSEYVIKLFQRLTELENKIKKWKARKRRAMMAKT